MKRRFSASLASASLVSLSLAVAGCSDDTQEAPDITEAIPLDAASSDPEASEQEGAQSDTDFGATDESFAEGQAANGSATPDLPGAGSAGTSSGERALPDTMERGANPPGMTQPPAGSKVQPADG